MKSETEPTSAVRNRTRRAILDAAIRLFSENPAASLADIADAAEVGRTTLHRYFPSRSDLVNELVVDIDEQINAATHRAQPGEGLAVEALERLIEEYFDLSDLMTFMFNMPEIAQAETWEDETETDQLLLRLIERGHRDGSIDSELTPEWIAMELIWAALFGAWDYVRSGHGSRPEARRMVLRSILKAVKPAAPL